MSFFETLDHIKKEYQQLQQQLQKVRQESEKKNQEMAGVQKQYTQVMESVNGQQVELVRQQEIVKRLQQVIQQMSQHLSPDQQQHFRMVAEQATKVTANDVIMMQHQQQLMQALGSGQLAGFPPQMAQQLAAMAAMEMKPNDMMAMAAMQGGFNPMQMQAAMAMQAQMGQLNQLFQNPAAAAQLMGQAMAANPMAQLASMQQKLSAAPAQPPPPSAASSANHTPNTLLPPPPALGGVAPTSSSNSSAHNHPTPLSHTPLANGSLNNNNNGTASPVQRANSSRSGSNSGTPLAKKFKPDHEPNSRPISSSGKSDKSDEGSLMIDVQNEEGAPGTPAASQQAFLMNQTPGLNGQMAAV